MRTILTRTVYVRITKDGKRNWVEIGTLNRYGDFKLNTKVIESKGIPLTGLFEVGDEE